jgi:hypothetical protein
LETVEFVAQTIDHAFNDIYRSSFVPATHLERLLDNLSGKGSVAQRGPRDVDCGFDFAVYRANSASHSGTVRNTTVWPQCRGELTQQLEAVIEPYPSAKQALFLEGEVLAVLGNPSLARESGLQRVFDLTPLHHSYKRSARQVHLACV